MERRPTDTANEFVTILFCLPGVSGLLVAPVSGAFRQALAATFGKRHIKADAGARSDGAAGSVVHTTVSIFQYSVHCLRLFGAIIVAVFQRKLRHPGAAFCQRGSSNALADSGCSSSILNPIICRPTCHTGLLKAQNVDVTLLRRVLQGWQ